MPWNGPTATPPPRPAGTGAIADVPSPAAQPVSSPAAPGVLSGGATSANRGAPQGGGPSDRFSTFQYNVPGSGNQGGGQGGRNAPIYTALNLGGLFGGGGQPQGAPSQTPRPAVPGPMAQGGMSKAPSSMGPFLPPGARNTNPADLASATSAPNWWKGLGGAAGNTMNPTQLASAVRKPNWWQGLGNA
jgi:hypothetical protein